MFNVKLACMYRKLVALKNQTNPNLFVFIFSLTFATKTLQSEENTKYVNYGSMNTGFITYLAENSSLYRQATYIINFVLM